MTCAKAAAVSFWMLRYSEQQFQYQLWLIYQISWWSIQLVKMLPPLLGKQ